jgi:hypothetical protein
VSDDVTGDLFERVRVSALAFAVRSGSGSTREKSAGYEVACSRASGVPQIPAPGRLRATPRDRSFGLSMTQDETNRGEWENPDNWGGPDWMAIYFSKRDTRTWVPKKLPWMGWTLNLGRDAGVRWLIGILVGLPTLMVGIALAMALALDAH